MSTHNDSAPTPEAALRSFLQRVDPATPRVVVRHADEGRIVSHDSGEPGDDRAGYAVRRVTYVILTARLLDPDDPGAPSQPVQQRIDDLSAARVRAVLDHFPIRALFRSDHIT